MEGSTDFTQPLALGDVPGDTRRTVGRPTTSPEQRAINDEKYKQTVELMNSIPMDAKEPKYYVYEAHHSRDTKVSTTPLAKIPLQEWKDRGFNERDTLSSFLLEEFGEGRFLISAHDAYGSHLSKIPSFAIIAGDPDMEISSRGRGFRRRERDDDYDDDEDDFEDPIASRDARANVADKIAATVRSANSLAEVQARQSTDVFSLMMLTQQRAEESRQAEERRRDEMRREEAKMREDERRRDEERRREDEKIERQREEERRREAAEARRADEERRREEERRKDQERREEFQQRIESENRRLQMILGALPIVEKLFKPDNSLQQTLLASLANPKKDDSITTVLLTELFKSRDKPGLDTIFMQQLQQMMAAGQQMNQAQLTNMLEFSSTMNKQLMERALKLMLESPQGKTEEGRSMIEKVISAVQGAAEIVKTLVPQGGPAPMGQQQQRVAHQPQHGFNRQPPAQQPQQPAQVPQPVQAPAPEAQTIPRGNLAVLGCLMAIQQHQAGVSSMTAQESQSVYQHLLNEMPLDVRVAVLERDQMRLFQLMKPTIDASPELTAWIKGPGVFQWLQQFVPTLIPSVEAVWGPMEQQRKELSDYYLSLEQQPVQQDEQPVEQPVEQPAEQAAQEQPVPEAPAAQAELMQPDDQMPPMVQEAEVTPEAIPGPGALPLTNTGSHLDGGDV